MYKFPNFWTFSFVLMVVDRREHLSSSTDTQWALKHECH
jgi:hypothetical protein